MLYRYNTIQYNTIHDLKSAFFFQNRAVYVITSVNMLDPERSQMTIEHGAYSLHAGKLSL
jgi:hypothetical protein